MISYAFHAIHTMWDTAEQFAGNLPIWSIPIVLVGAGALAMKAIKE